MPKNDFAIQDNTEMNVRATAFQAQCLMRNLKTQTLIERAEMLHNDAGQMAKNDLVAQGNADMTVHVAALRAQQTLQNLTAQTPHTRTCHDDANLRLPDSQERPYGPRQSRHDSAYNGAPSAAGMQNLKARSPYSK